MRAVLIATLVLVLAAGAAAARVRLAVSPATVPRGGAVLVTGNAGSCPVGDAVFAISAAFPGRQFGAQGALVGIVRRGGSFAIRGHVRARLAKGRYAVTARCGGGNLGVTAYVRVR